jgi:sialic acid synthase SpsE
MGKNYVQDICKGDIILVGDVRSVRPGYGVPPKYLEDILGTRAKRDILACTPVLAADLT